MIWGSEYKLSSVRQSQGICRHKSRLHSCCVAVISVKGTARMLVRLLQSLFKLMLRVQSLHIILVRTKSSLRGHNSTELYPWIFNVLLPHHWIWEWKVPFSRYKLVHLALSCFLRLGGVMCRQTGSCSIPSDELYKPAFQSLPTLTREMFTDGRGALKKTRANRASLARQ